MENKKEFLKNTVKSLALVTLFSSCNTTTDKNAVGTFNTLGYQKIDHLEQAITYTRVKNKGFARSGTFDFDGDNRNDMYVVAADSTVFHTKSRREFDGLDSSVQRVWFQANKEAYTSGLPGSSSQ